MARNRSFITALALGTALASPLPAWALEADAFGEAFKAFIASQDGALTYASASLDGDSVTLADATLGLAPEAGGAELGTLQLGDLTFEGVSETDIGYEAASLMREGISGTIDDINEAGDSMEWSIGRLGMEGISIPNADAEGDTVSMIRNAGFFYKRGFVEDMTLNLNGQDYVTMESVDVRTDVDASPATFTYTMADLVTNLSVVADEAPELRAWIEGTGYETITTDFTSEGTWDVGTGVLDVPVNRITLEGMGEFDMVVNLGGLTPAFMEAIGEASEQMQSEDQQAQQAAGMQLLGLMSQLVFGELTIAYRDGGMADALLDYYAQENGQTKDELVQQTVGVLPLALGQLGVPALQAQITESVTDFLNDPKSITVSLKPDAPVPAPVLMGAAASSPGQLAEALNASVTSGAAGMME